MRQRFEATYDAFAMVAVKLDIAILKEPLEPGPVVQRAVEGIAYRVTRAVLGNNPRFYLTPLQPMALTLHRRTHAMVLVGW